MKILHIFRHYATLAFALVAVALLLPSTGSAAELLGLYTFEGASPRAFDDVSGQGLHPSNVGTGALDATGYEGQAASFSGTHTPIEVPIDISPGTNPTLTIGAWVKPDGIGQRGVFGHDNGGWDRGLTAGGNSGGNWRPVGGTEHNSGLAVSVGAWQFVAVVYNGTTSAKFYADTNSVVIAPHSAGPGRGTLGIGGLNHLTTWRFDGLIDNFFIFDDALTDAEIEAIRVGGLTGIQTVGGLLGNLASDYQNGAGGQTSDDVGITAPGGTWHYYSDTDNDPTNGGLVLLTHGGVGLEGGSGYGGTGTIFGDCCGDMPVVSNDGLFDGITTPPAGTLATHPGSTSSTPPEFGVIEFRASAFLSNLSLAYGINNPNVGGDGVDWRIRNNAGAILFSGTQDGNSVNEPGAAIANLGPGESIWLVIGNGPGDDAGGDQSFVSLSLNGDSSQVSVSSTSVDEGEAAGTAVGTLTTAAAGTYTYSLVAGAGDTDNANFQIGGAGTDTLQTNAVLSAAAQRSHSIRVRSTETGGGGSYEEVFTISVTPAGFAGGGPVAFYRFDGDATDSSGNGNHGNVTGALAFAAGQDGQALDNDPTITNFVNLPLNIRPGVAPRCTIGMWVDADAIDNRDTMFSTDNGAFDRGLNIDDRGGYSAYSAFRGNGVLAGNAANVADGYVFACATFDQIRGVTRLYTDGIGYQVASFHDDNLTYLRVGSRPGSESESLDGKIDSIFVYNTVLTFEQIEAIRTGGAAVIPAAGVDVWNIDFESHDNAGFSPANPVTNFGIGTGDVWNSFPIEDVAGNPSPVSTNPSISNIRNSRGETTSVSFALTGDGGGGSAQVAGFNNNSNSTLPVGSDYMLWNLPGLGIPDSVIEWAFTGLEPGGRYEVAAIGGIGGGRDFTLRVDSDGDSDLSDETGANVDQGHGRGAAVIAVADGTGTIIGDSTAIGGNEPNWGGMQLRKLVSATAPTDPTIAFDFGMNYANDADGQLVSPKLHAGVDFDNDGNGDWWNRVGAVTDAADLDGVYDIQGNHLPDVTIQVLDYRFHNPNDGSAGGWGTTLDVPEETMRALYHYGGVGNFTITVKGLTPNFEYAVETFTALNNAIPQQIRVNGVFVNGLAAASGGEGDGYVSGHHGFLPRHGLVFLATSDGNGQLVITFDVTAITPFVQAIRISTPAESSGTGKLFSGDISAMHAGSDITMSGVEPFYGYGNIWNNIMLPHHTGTATTDIVTVLRDSDGYPTPATFRLLNPLNNISGFNSGALGNHPLHSGYLIMTAAGYPNTFDFEITGLPAKQPYEFYLYPGAANSFRDINVTLDTNGDGSLVGEATTLVDGLPTGEGALFTANTDINGRLFGQLTTPVGVTEPNWSGFQLRELRKATVIRLR